MSAVASDAMIPVHRPDLGPIELAAVARVFESRWLGIGALSAEFESRLREFLGVRHVIAVNSGTAALHLARDHNLAVIEDAAHAFGSRTQGRALGTLGAMGCFSFDPIKNITCGSGGALPGRRADTDIAGGDEQARRAWSVLGGT
jgi:dTDP-4-amino-4,6-dideoxygalactose transaminase